MSSNAGQRRRGGLWLVVWAGLACGTAHCQTNEAGSGPLLPTALQELAQHAEDGDAKAQFELGTRFAEGNGVPRDFTKSVEWIRKAAEQGDANAQLQLGMNYLEGKGIKKDLDQAIAWLYKAAGHEAVKTGNAESSLAAGSFIKKITTLEGDEFKDVTVVRTDPDGILINYKTKRGGFGMAKLKFKILPLDLQKGFGYNSQAEAAFATQQLALEEIGYAETAKNVGEQNAKSSEIVGTLTDIVSGYHRTHTYLTNAAGTSIYVCGDMACDVWNMVISKGITAKIAVGDVDSDINSVAQARHAWVLAEIREGDWLGLECTGGYTVRSSDNKRYFHGCRFATPKDYRDFEQLKRQFNDAIVKGRAADDAYKQLVASYNSAGDSGRVALKIQLQQQEGVLNDRGAELKQLKDELDKFQLTED